MKTLLFSILTVIMSASAVQANDTSAAWGHMYLQRASEIRSDVAREVAQNMDLDLEDKALKSSLDSYEANELISELISLEMAQ